MDIRSFFISLSLSFSARVLAWIFVCSLAIILIGAIFLFVFDKNQREKRSYRLYYLAVGLLLGVQGFIMLCADKEVVSVRNILSLTLLEIVFVGIIILSYRLFYRLFLRLKNSRIKNKNPTIDLRSFIPEKEFLDRRFERASKQEFSERLEEAGEQTVIAPRQSYIKEMIKNSLSLEQPPVQPNIEERAKSVQPDTDYSHVKNIMDRLSFYDLNMQEKKLVGDLNLYVQRVENGENDFALKEKISDGLGGLLRIMAKYNL